VSFPVDTACEPAHDHDAGRRELAPEHARDLGTVRRAGAGADDRNRRLCERPDFAVSSEVQPGRRIVDRAQQLWQLASA
jgi:hypothetical protein